MNETSPLTLEILGERLEKIKSEIGQVELIAVTKFADVENIEMAWKLGQTDFAENKVQNMEMKSRALSGKNLDIRWHMIGELQTNKISKLLGIPGLVAIHSVDELYLAQKLVDKIHLIKGQQIDFYLQVNISHETEKKGFTDSTKLAELYHWWRSLPFQSQKKFVLKGLMGIGPIRTNNFEQDTEKAFLELSELRDKLANEWQYPLTLSMGMSNDYKIALKYKTDCIRVGSSLFS